MRHFLCVSSHHTTWWRSKWPITSLQNRLSNGLGSSCSSNSPNRTRSWVHQSFRACAQADDAQMSPCFLFVISRIFGLSLRKTVFTDDSEMSSRLLSLRWKLTLCHVLLNDSPDSMPSATICASGLSMAMFAGLPPPLVSRSSGLKSFSVLEHSRIY